MVPRLFQKLFDFLVASAPLRERALKYSTHRLLYLALVAIPVSIAHIPIFWFGVTVEQEVERVWKTGIIHAHLTLSSLMLLLVLGRYYVARTQRQGGWLCALQYLGIFTVMGSGIAVTTLDQLVRSEITPFLISCIVFSIIFRIEPALSLTVYVISYTFYGLAVRLVQPDTIILSSNLANGITAVGIGISLSLILWNSFVRNVEQEAYIKQQQQEIRVKNQELKRLAAIDPLTGLLNRRSFEEAVANEISRMRRDGDPSCIAVIDIDDFKYVNDKYGHPVGDELLQGLAELMTSTLRANDLLSRWGGEEFILFFAQTTLEQAERIAERLRESIASERFHIHEHVLHVTASFGLAAVDVSAKDPFVESYSRADQALYAAKGAGKNRIAG